MIIKEYKISEKEEWNSFLANSRNSTFLFDRDFMDYHSDRFQDHSLMFYYKDKLAGIFPANISDNAIYSHQGLSYGGWVVENKARSNITFNFIYHTLKYLNEKGIDLIYYKAFPNYYNIIPGGDVEYCLYKLKSSLIRKDITTIVNINSPLPYQTRRKRSVKKAKKNNITINECDSFESFWSHVLEPNLLNVHGLKPVHSVDEIKLLNQRFPKNIRQFNAYEEDEILAGCTILDTPTTAHAQYISANSSGKETGALDLLMDHLINNEFQNKKHFDFGISTEDQGKILNNGLLEWKEGFGGRSVSVDHYEISTKNYVNLKLLLD